MAPNKPPSQNQPQISKFRAKPLNGKKRKEIMNNNINNKWAYPSNNQPGEVAVW